MLGCQDDSVEGDRLKACRTAKLLFIQSTVLCPRAQVRVEILHCVQDEECWYTWMRIAVGLRMRSAEVSG